MTVLPMERDAAPELCDTDAEQRVLGAILADDATYWQVEPLLGADDFSDPMHRRLFEEIARRKAKNQNVSLFTIKGFAAADPGAVEAGGLQYLQSIAASRPSARHLPEYARAIRRHAQRRAIVVLADQLRDEALAPDGDDLTNTCDAAGEALYDIAHGFGGNDGPKDIAELVRKAAQAAENAHNNPDVAVISTGLAPIDDRLGGLRPAKLVVLGAVTSAGKTGLAQQIALNVSRQRVKAGEGTIGRQVLIFSKEMEADELGGRYLAFEARIPGDRVEAGRFTPAEWDRIAKAPTAYHNAGLSIDDSPNLSVAQMRARAITHRRRKGRLDLVCVDHLGFIKPADQRDRPDAQLEQICKDLKRLANELKCPVLLISHVNRKYDERASKRPRLADLHGGSGIEKAADDVWFLYREEVFLEADRPDESDAKAFADWATKLQRAKNKAEVFAAKRRGGAKDTAILKFNAPLIAFSDPEDDAAVTREDLLSLTGRQT